MQILLIRSKNSLFSRFQQFGKILDVEIIFNERGSKVNYQLVLFKRTKVESVEEPVRPLQPAGVRVRDLRERHRGRPGQRKAERDDRGRQEDRGEGRPAGRGESTARCEDPPSGALLCLPSGEQRHGQGGDQEAPDASCKRRALR